MAEEVKLRLLFANDGTQEMSVSTSTPVKNLKKDIMETFWPATLMSIENVERIRLFEGGKELGGKGMEDWKSLREARITVTQVATPVHVSIVQKVEASPEQEAAKSSGGCWLM
mmetsp:Transcript_5281/g.15019  ORF Transcript_5281/g.15019 Transcript_5281/m.15019 type:complete len:113 (-) Transcript_5281:173-511(-)